MILLGRGGISVILREASWCDVPTSQPTRDYFMATATMATAAGAAALLYYTVNRKIQGVDEEVLDGDAISTGQDHVCIEQLSNRLVQAPATWLEIISTMSETLRFTYLETLGKWPIADLAFGINFLLKRQGILRFCDVFGGEDSVQVTNQDIIPELGYLMKLLTLCWYFSKKSFPMFLKDMAIRKKMFSYINLSPG